MIQEQSEFQTYTFLLTLFSTPVYVMNSLTLTSLFCHFIKILQKYTHD